MRIRLTFEDPLPAYKCWYEIPASCSTIRDLQRAVRKGFNLDQYCKTTRLDLDGFFLLPTSTVAGSLKDGDLLQVMIRKKGDSLPPRHLPVSGGKKRSSNDAGLPDTDRKSSKKMKSSPNKKPLAPPAKQGNAQRQPGQSQQKQQQQSNAQNNKKKNGQDNKKAQQHNNNKPQDGQPLASNVSGNNTSAQGKGSKNNKANKASNTNSNAKSDTKNNTQISRGPKNNSSTTRKPDHSVEERRKVHFAPESASQRKKTATTETSSDGDSSDSDSSDSESSSSSSESSDSSKNSSDSSNSDSDSSDESASGSDNNKGETKAVITRVIPGKGKGATKSRNTRRKLLKQKMAEAHEADAGSDSDTSAPNPLKRDYKAGTQPVNSTPTTSGKAAKIAAPQVNGKDAAQDNKKKVTVPQANGKTAAPQANGKGAAPQANKKAATQASAPPKVIMTSVDLKDSEFVTKSNPKRVTRSSQKKPNGVTQEAPATPQPEILRRKDSQNNKTVAAEKEADDTSEADTTPRDYNSLPKLDDNLAVGDIIAFKTLEMGPSYQPIISDFKEATVLSSSMTDMMAEVQLSRKFRTPVQLDDDGNPILGKFDIYDEEEFERTRRGIVSLDILGLADCRIISKK
ncbi:hypothetical protein BGZ96_012599 [Linnemannia gamsii]|uniref:Coilin n=1 Tax=Linnemannia gamsii TaxID=64522 RepID=A0ABQ7JQS1_9FUNG|nr:hypothetical protein BGZ96_012599 [Linnemannia gamsii]